METLGTALLLALLAFAPTGYIPENQLDAKIKKEKEIEDFFRYNDSPLWGNDRVIYVTYCESRMAVYVEIRHDELIKGKMYTAMFSGGDVDKERAAWYELSDEIEKKYKHRFYFHNLPEFTQDYLIKIMEKISIK